MTLKQLPRNVNTVIVGNGPSALILSYILHGNIPYYNTAHSHPDPILHEKLSSSPCLLDVDVQDLTAHFSASRFSYSSQSLPVNTLLDTLLRPLADTTPGKHDSCVEWRLQERKRTSHIVVGDTLHAGGQWADNPVSASCDIGALSYAEMLSLPGYPFEEHYHNIMGGKHLPAFHRPTRRQVANYLATYPRAVGIKDTLFTGIKLDGISRTAEGFHIASHDIACKNLVLASGTFTNLLAARPLLQPLARLPKTCNAPLLVIGSGFTAADVIISAPTHRKVIHIYKWDPENRPSPLRACHKSAYPEYAAIYKRMKQAATRGTGAVSPLQKRSDENYEGLPNTWIKEVAVRDDCAIVWLETSDKQEITREVSNMEYVIGRRGSLDFLDIELRAELLSPTDKGIAISGQTLRPFVEKSAKIADHVFAIGSLAGDSLIRFAYGSCVLAASMILERERFAEPAVNDSSHNPNTQRIAEAKKKSIFTHCNQYVGHEREACIIHQTRHR